MPSTAQFPRNLSNSLLTSFDSACTQHNRLIALRFPETSRAIEHTTLLPARFTLTTALSEDTHIEMVCRTANANVALKTYLGQPIELSVLLANGSYRIISGVVLAAASHGSDGEFTTLVLTIGSMFQALKHRTTSRVFQKSSVPEIVRTILTEHQENNPVFALCFTLTEHLHYRYTKRELVIQYNETDYAFIRRLLAEEGITYYHRSGAPDEQGASGLVSQRSSDQQSVWNGCYSNISTTTQTLLIRIFEFLGKFIRTYAKLSQ